MPIIIDSMTEEQFNDLKKRIAGADDMESRLNEMAALNEYRYVDELLDETEWKTRLDAAEKARDDYKQKYIDRFFSGTGLEDKEIEITQRIDEEEKNDSATALNPQTYDELYKEE